MDFIFAIFQAGSSCGSACDEEFKEQQKDQREFQEIGPVKWLTYKKYFQAIRSPFLVIFVILAFVGAETSGTGLNYFLSEW